MYHARDGDAVAGVDMMIKKYLSIFNPTRGAFVLDGGISQWRLDKVATYKSGRKPMEEDLAAQFALSRS
jgi:5'-3' exonuclease